MQSFRGARAFKFGAALAVGLALAACAKGAGDDALNGAAPGAPGRSS